MSSRDIYPQGELVPGTVYRVLRLLAEGGMGTVYDVEDTSIGKRYVLKTLHSDLGNRADLARRMQAEARVLARLNHPNVVEVMTAGVTADDARLPYYVMERLNGQNLRVVLQKKGALELHHAVHIAIDLLDALDHAHDRGIVHRDVKPENIFLHRTATGMTVTKLLDFGVMTLLGSQTHTGGRFVGTLRYAAPEQIAGDTATPKADLYAAGLVLYEMLAGKGPFDFCHDPREVAAAHLHAIPQRLRELTNIVPKIDELVANALAKDPADRPKDAFAFASTLRALPSSKGASLTQQTTVSGISLEASSATGVAFAATERQGSGTQPLAQGSTLRLGEPLPEAQPVGVVDRGAETLTRAPVAAAMVPQVDTSIMDAAIQWPSSQSSASSVSERPAVTSIAPGRSSGAGTTALLMTLFATLTLVSFAGAWIWVTGRGHHETTAREGATSLPIQAPSVDTVKKIDNTSPVSVSAADSPAIPKEAPSAPVTAPSAATSLATVPKRVSAAASPPVRVMPKPAPVAAPTATPGKVGSGLPSRAVK